MRRCIKRKKCRTNESWFPTAEDGCFEVSVHHDAANVYRVVCFGDDDFGLVKSLTNMADAMDCFHEVKDGTTQQELRARGFMTA